MKKIYFVLLLATIFVACNEDFNQTDSNLGTSNNINLSTDKKMLEEVAVLLSNLNLDLEDYKEIHQSISQSLEYGLDECYYFREILNFNQNNKIINTTNSSLKQKLTNSLSLSRNNILDKLTNSNIQIYWPYSEDWDQKTIPVITFADDNKNIHTAFKSIILPEGTIKTDTLFVDEEYAKRNPVIVINLNTLPYEEIPDFSNNKFINKDNVLFSSKKAINKINTNLYEIEKVGDPIYSIKIGKFMASKQYDDWANGGSEFVIHIGAVDQFKINTVDDLRNVNPNISRVRITRSRKDISKKRWTDVNAVMVSDSQPNDIDLAFMLVEEDQGSGRFWEANLGLELAGKKYRIDAKLPFKSGDDMIYQVKYRRNFIFSTLNYNTKNNTFVEHTAGNCYWTLEVNKGQIINY
ncbi:hypothetical protein O2K51_09580 [Apibacter raozihei]|uniref:hypothetical protein n=1 Tax=Apibacter raozihei TaxID=2500547 RepID=UPI000FE2B9BF|nr:hypothetical protein [Apibacter raozihei]